MTPTDILDELIMYIPCDSMRREVGELIKRLPQAKRKILERLTSDDTANMRPWWK